jgi:hypothetical protein
MRVRNVCTQLWACIEGMSPSISNWIGLHYCFVPIGLATMSESELSIIGDGLCWSKGDT